MVGDIIGQIEAFPVWLQWWLRWMQVLLILVPFFFIRRREAQILLVAQVLNFGVGFLVLQWDGGYVTKLFGLGHVFWAIAYVWIAWRWRDGLIDWEGRPLYRAWIVAAMITLTISLPLDAYDLVQYANGMRTPMVEYYSN